MWALICILVQIEALFAVALSFPSGKSLISLLNNQTKKKEGRMPSVKASIRLVVLFVATVIATQDPKITITQEEYQVSSHSHKSAETGEEHGAWALRQTPHFGPASFEDEEGDVGDNGEDSDTDLPRIVWHVVPGSKTTDSGMDITRGQNAICPTPPGFDRPGDVLGFDIRSEDHQGSGDDSALNGIAFLCFKDKSKFKVIRSLEGSWGSYSGQPVICTGSTPWPVEFKSEFDHPGDNGGGVNLRMICRDGRIIEGVGGRSFGTWAGQRAFCSNSHYLCGLRNYVQKAQGPGDDMALTGFKIACCHGRAPSLGP